MRFFTVILCFALPLLVKGQVEWQHLNGFNYSDYPQTDIYKETGSYGCPWYSLVIHGAHYMTTNIAIDVVVDSTQLEVLKGHKFMFSNDLYSMFMEWPPEALELSQIAGQKFSRHIPGQVYPMYRYYKLLDTETHVQVGIKNGWHIKLVKGTIPGTGGKLAMAIKHVKDNVWIVSAAIFMRLYYKDLLNN